jgi:hypothetical protein
MSEVEMDKEALFGAMSAGYDRIESALAALTPAQWLAHPGAWSVKDVVAHLTAWMTRLVDIVDAAVQDKPPAQPVVGQSDADIDAHNAEIYEEHRDDTAQQTLGAFRRSYGDLTTRLRPLPWDDLAAVGRFDWLGDTPLWRLIAGDTYEHFAEHLPEIERVGHGGSQG